MSVLCGGRSGLGLRVRRGERKKGGGGRGIAIADGDDIIVDRSIVPMADTVVGRVFVIECGGRITVGAVEGLLVVDFWLACPVAGRGRRRNGRRQSPRRRALLRSWLRLVRRFRERHGRCSILKPSSSPV